MPKSKDIDWAPIAEILATGGNLYMHPKDLQNLHIAAIKKNKILNLDKIFASELIQKGTVVAAKVPNFCINLAQ
jgi:hypothetical protein